MVVYGTITYSHRRVKCIHLALCDWPLHQRRAWLRCRHLTGARPIARLCEETGWRHTTPVHTGIGRGRGDEQQHVTVYALAAYTSTARPLIQQRASCWWCAATERARLPGTTQDKEGAAVEQAASNGGEEDTSGCASVAAVVAILLLDSIGRHMDRSMCESAVVSAAQC